MQPHIQGTSGGALLSAALAKMGITNISAGKVSGSQCLHCQEHNSAMLQYSAFVSMPDPFSWSCT